MANNQFALTPQLIAHEFFRMFIHELRRLHPWTVGLARYQDCGRNHSVKLGTSITIREPAVFKPFDLMPDIDTMIAESYRMITLTRQPEVRFRLERYDQHRDIYEVAERVLLPALQQFIDAVVDQWPLGAHIVTVDLPTQLQSGVDVETICDPPSGLCCRMLSGWDPVNDGMLFRFDMIFGLCLVPLTPAEEAAVSYLQQARARLMLQLERMQA